MRFAHKQAAAEVEQFLRSFAGGKRMMSRKRRRTQEKQKERSDDSSAEAVREALKMHPQRLQELVAVPPRPPQGSAVVS